MICVVRVLVMSGIKNELARTTQNRLLDDRTKKTTAPFQTCPRASYKGGYVTSVCKRPSGGVL